MTKPWLYYNFHKIRISAHDENSDYSDFDFLDLNKTWEILREMRIPDNLTCLLRNLYAGQEQ